MTRNFPASHALTHWNTSLSCLYLSLPSFLLSRLESRDHHCWKATGGRTPWQQTPILHRCTGKSLLLASVFFEPSYLPFKCVLSGFCSTPFFGPLSERSVAKSVLRMISFAARSVFCSQIHVVHDKDDFHVIKIVAF